MRSVRRFWVRRAEVAIPLEKGILNSARVYEDAVEVRLPIGEGSNQYFPIVDRRERTIVQANRWKNFHQVRRQGGNDLLGVDEDSLFRDFAQAFSAPAKVIYEEGERERGRYRQLALEGAEQGEKTILDLHRFRLEPGDYFWERKTGLANSVISTRAADDGRDVLVIFCYSPKSPYSLRHCHEEEGEGVCHREEIDLYARGKVTVKHRSFDETEDSFKLRQTSPRAEEPQEISQNTVEEPQTTEAIEVPAESKKKKGSLGKTKKTQSRAKKS